MRSGCQTTRHTDAGGRGKAKPIEIPPCAMPARPQVLNDATGVVAKGEFFSEEKKPYG